MRIVLATWLASALVLACGSDPGAAIEAPTTGQPGEPDAHGEGVGALETRTDAGATPRGDAAPSSDASADDGGTADAGTWTGTGEACSADAQCETPLVGPWCLRGYCADLLCIDEKTQAACTAKGGTCTHELRGPLGTTTCEIRR